MGTQLSDRQTFMEWLREPESLVGLSAVIIALCSLGIALYETSVIRQAQRASVWPHVLVGPSLQGDRINLLVQNAGIGPARIRAASVKYEGETLGNWTELFQELVGEDIDSLGLNSYNNLINGRVLPTSEEFITIFGISETSDTGPGAVEAMTQFRQAIEEGAIDVEVCYCSVYDECWVSSMQDVVGRLRGEKPVSGFGEVDNCDSAPRSAI